MELNPNYEHPNLISQDWAPAKRVASNSDYAVCRQIMRAASKNYSFASYFFPESTLHHVEALYALMRVGDDRVDVSHSGFNSPYEAIDDWERAYWSAFECGYSQHPVMRSYLNTALECGIPAEIMAPYFLAMKEDIRAKDNEIIRYDSFEALLCYVEGSAIPVGRAMTYILGVRQPYSFRDALPGADSLSIAMQLSNFWRDIGNDWDIGRVYIPQEDFMRFGYSEDDLAGHRITSNFIDLLEFEFTRTLEYYSQARQSIKFLASGQWAVLSSLEVYQAIILDIRRNHYDVFNRRAGANILGKLGLAIKAYSQVIFKLE